MKSNYDLEINVLSCLVQKPILMEQLKLQDKHFVKHKRLFQFMKSFYAKFETFDLVLIYQVCKDKFKIIDYITWLVEVEPVLSNFDKYQDMLIEQYEESKKNKWIIDKIYQTSNDLYCGKINLDEFNKRIQEIQNNADEIFKKE